MTTTKCPRCDDGALGSANRELHAAAGVVGEDVCSGCSGRFLPPEITERVVVEELGLDREVLREIAGLFSGLRVVCPGCTALMRPLRLRGVPADLCFSCGGCWLDEGELQALSGGRYLEAKPPAAPAPAMPVVVGRETRALLTLGRGPRVVLFDSLDDVDERALSQAFARTDGLTDIDAQILARHNTGVVVEGVSPAGAIGLRALLQQHGIATSIVDERVLRLPPPLHSGDVDVYEAGVSARFHTGPPLRFSWSSVLAVAGGVVRTERHWLGVLERTEGVVVELLQQDLGQPARRLRVMPNKQPEKEQQQQKLVAAATSSTAVGRAGMQAAWPRYRRARELERELVWVAWRAARWPAD